MTHPILGYRLWALSLATLSVLSGCASRTTADESEAIGEDSAAASVDLPGYAATVRNNAATVCYHGAATRVSQTSGTLAITRGGSPGSPEVYSPASAGSVYANGVIDIRASNVVLKGFDLRNTTVTVSGSNVRITENEFSRTRDLDSVVIDYGSRYVRIDRNRFLNGSASGGDSIQVNIRNGEDVPRFHRVDHNLFDGGTYRDGGSAGKAVYLGLVNKTAVSNGSTLIEKNKLENFGLKYSFEIKSSYNLVENNVIDAVGTNSKIDNRHGEFNVYHRNRQTGGFGFLILDSDGYVIANHLANTRHGLWISSGDSEFGGRGNAVTPGSGKPNHPRAKDTRVVANETNKITYGGANFHLRDSELCPSGIALRANSVAASESGRCRYGGAEAVSSGVSADVPEPSLGEDDAECR